MTVTIYRRETGLFEIDDSVNNEYIDGQPTATAIGDLITFKTKNGAKLVSNVNYADVTVEDNVEGGTFTFNSSLELMSKLKDIGFFANFSNGGDSSGVQTVTGSGVDNTDPQNPVINLNHEVLVLDTSREVFNSGTTGNVVVKSYTIPANTFRQDAVLHIKCRVKRLLGSGNPFLTLTTSSTNGSLDDQRFINGVAYPIANRNVVMKDTTFYSIASSGTIPDDLDSPTQSFDFSEKNIDRSIDTTLDLILNFSTGGDEFQLEFLTIEQIY